MARLAAAAPVDDVVHFYHVDPLGSVRAVTDMQGNVVSRHDYLPFGEEIPCAMGWRDQLPGYCNPQDGSTLKFTGKERDPESGLDYFGARYMSAAQGRFTSPDEPLSYSDVEDPQSWNLYAYTGNNPLNRVDPDGHDWFYKDGESPVWIDCKKNGTCASEPPEGFNRWTPSGSGDSALVSTSHGTYRLTADRPDAFVFDAAAKDISWETAGQLSFAWGLGRLGFGLGRAGLSALAGGAEVSVGLTRPLMRSLGAAGDDMLLKKAVNSNLPHAAARGVERGIFVSQQQAAEALRGLSAQISKSGAFPPGTVVDSAGRFLVPVGNNGLAVYQLAANGTAKLKTVLIAR